MKWKQFIDRYPKGSKVFLEIGKKRLVDVAFKPPRVDFRTNMDNASQIVLDYMPNLIRSEANMMEAVLYGRALADGPKVFSPTMEELTILQEMKLNITIQDYVQPFETVIIELPEGYSNRKIITCPQAGQVIDGHLLPEIHKPLIMVLHFRSECQAIMSALIFNSDQSIKTGLVPILDEHLEQYVNSVSGEDTYDYVNTQESTDAELMVTCKVLKACMNYCLLLDEIGIIKRGADNPSHHERLKRYIKVAEKGGDQKRIEKAKDELLTDPIRYEIKQRIKLYRTVDCSSELPQTTDKRVAPHHRRGYYKMQPYGTGNSLRKRIRIPAVFVNKKFFFGDVSDTEVSYY